MVGTPKNMVLLGTVRGRQSTANRSEDESRCAGGERPEEPGAQPVHVEEGERQDEMVTGFPAPGHPEGLRAGQ